MNKWLATWHVVVTALLVALVVSWASRHLANDSGTEYPTRPIRVVVPFSAGGGTDTFARVMQKGIAETGSLSQPLVIVNQPGGAGTIGSREVKEASSGRLHDPVSEQCDHQRRIRGGRRLWPG